jgi:hypothetical protein
MKRSDETKAAMDELRKRGAEGASMTSQKPWRWSDTENEDLRKSWLAGERACEIGARLGRSGIAVCSQAKKLDLPRRGHSSLRYGGGRPAGFALGAMKPETPSQASKWPDILFEDAKVKPEGMMRGLPPLNMSAQSSTAAVAAGE